MAAMRERSDGLFSKQYLSERVLQDIAGAPFTVQVAEQSAKRRIRPASAHLPPLRDNLLFFRSPIRPAGANLHLRARSANCRLTGWPSSPIRNTWPAVCCLSDTTVVLRENRQGRFRCARMRPTDINYVHFP